MIRLSRLPRMPRRMKRADSLLIILALVLASLLMNFCSMAGEPLRPLEAEEPLILADEPALPDTPVSPPPAATSLKAGAPVRFLMHNVANYFVAGEQQRSRYTIRPKSEKAREAVADVISHAQPEIVGLIEIGGSLALEDLRQRLAARGWDFPHSRVLTRRGEDRALALLSRHPIVQDNSRADVKLYGEQRRRMLRGILDVTIQLPDGRQFRIIGAHLKSRVAQDPAAASALRAKEAHTLAMHIQEVIRQNPGMPLVVYGDWNDGPADASVRVLRQGLSRDAALTRLNPKDSRGESWTLYHDSGKQYCTFDQIYVNKALRKRVGRKGASGIIDIPAAANASDHRALWCELK